MKSCLSSPHGLLRDWMAIQAPQGAPSFCSKLPNTVWNTAATDQSLGQAPAQRGGLERKEISLVFSLFTIPSGGRPG